MNAEFLRAQDMLTAMQQQRDSALNANVHALVEIAALRRKAADLEEALKQAQYERDSAVNGLKEASSLQDS
jgi:hypothetical protein